MQISRKVVFFVSIIVACFFASFRNGGPGNYVTLYQTKLIEFRHQQVELLEAIKNTDITGERGKLNVRIAINNTRKLMKPMDFWLRYLEPIAYKSINGPLPVEWETEVFEKNEKPYKRFGAGLSLAFLYLGEADIHKDSLIRLIETSIKGTEVFAADSVAGALSTPDHFYLCNRLFLLNLAAIYTTGFECPDAGRILPELKIMLAGVRDIYLSYNQSFPATALTGDYLHTFDQMIRFVDAQPEDANRFDHFEFLKNHVNLLFKLNQTLIARYKVVSHSLADYSLNKGAVSIFDKRLYNAQDPRGIFIRVDDSVALAAIERVGKQLFYDPILSGNNQRSCGSCHKPAQYFSDTSVQSSLRYDHTGRLPRNTPSLINSVYNHLLMLDGKHITLQEQTKAVIGNKDEMACSEEEVLRKVLSCREYKTTFRKLLKHTPQQKTISYDHIVSAITFYYSKFSNCNAPFDNAMNNVGGLSASARSGFNIFMSKAQCATCHFVPQFNGVKPPYIGSEFEVLGVPDDTLFRRISPDVGRFVVNPADETRYAFRTGSIRNSAHTMPYMHNGVFASISQVIDFYNAGGGAGKGLQVTNQTLSVDSLGLTPADKSDLIAFIQSLDEDILFETPPTELPESGIKSLNNRKPGGEY